MNTKTLTKRKINQLVSLAHALLDSAEEIIDKKLKDVIAQTLNGHDSRTLRNWLNYIEAIEWVRRAPRHGSNGIYGHDRSTSYVINFCIIRQNLSLITNSSITEATSENPKDSGLIEPQRGHFESMPEPTEAGIPQRDASQLVESETKNLPSDDNARNTSSENETKHPL